MRLFVGNLFFGHAERFPSVHRHIANAIPQVIRPGFVHFSAFAGTASFPPTRSSRSSINHFLNFTLRNRTPPRILTRVNRPLFASRSTVRCEQASLAATSLFRKRISSPLLFSFFIFNPNQSGNTSLQSSFGSCRSTGIEPKYTRYTAL